MATVTGAGAIRKGDRHWTIRLGCAMVLAAQGLLLFAEDALAPDVGVVERLGAAVLIGVMVWAGYAYAGVGVVRLSVGLQGLAALLPLLWLVLDAVYFRERGLLALSVAVLHLLGYVVVAFLPWRRSPRLRGAMWFLAACAMNAALLWGQLWLGSRGSGWGPLTAPYAVYVVVPLLLAWVAWRLAAVERAELKAQA